jgi:ribosomal protein S18 acetylase RimI-like enzyme
MDGIKISIRQSVDSAQRPAAGEKGPRITLQAVTLEPAQPADELFLLEVFARARTEEMAVAGWPAEPRRLFLGMRYEAQRQSRSRRFPDAVHWIIRRDDVPAGCLIVNRSPDEILLLDLALLPEHRNKNVGALVMTALMEEAWQTRKAVRLRVEETNSAKEWYRRLGFRTTGESGGYLEMLWQPGSDRS